MSQAGKVLHLYVEVRSVAEEDGKLSERDDGGSHLMLQCPDILPHSQRSSTHSSPNRSPDPAPMVQHRAGGRNLSLPSSKSSSRHSVSFQLQNPDATGSPTQFQRQDVLYDNFGQFLEAFAPGTTGLSHHGSLGRTYSSDSNPYNGRIPISLSSTSSGRLTVPSIPTSNRRSYEIPEMLSDDGKTSVVSFGYIEKTNVTSMGARHSSACQNESDNPVNRMDGPPLPTHLRKRLSDPMWYNGQPSQGDPFPSLHYPARNQSPQGSPYLQRATLDPVARDATHRALEEFGSPELKCRFAGHIRESSSPMLPRHYESPRCRSWGGSPVLPRNTHTLPSKTQLQELDRGVCRGLISGLPRSPASDHLCAHISYSSNSAGPASNLHSHSPGQTQKRAWAGDESPRLSSKFHPPLPAGKPTDIQHEIPTVIFPTSNSSRASYQAGNSHHSVNGSYNANDNLNLSCKTHYQSSRSSSRGSDTLSPTSGRRSVSPSSHAEMAGRLALEATKLSSIFADRRTPSPTPSQTESLRSESPRTGGPFLRESQPYATLHGRRSPELSQVNNHNHSCKTDKPMPQTKPGRISPLLSQKGISSPASPALPARLHRAPATQSPVLDPRQQRSLSPTKDTSALHRYQPPQYTGDHKASGVEQRRLSHLFDRSTTDGPELSGRHLSGQNPEALPVSWTSRQQEWREAGPVQDGGKENYRLSPPRLYLSSKDKYTKSRGDKGGQTSVQHHKRLDMGMSKDQREDHSRGTSSQSSSGVTGSLGDSSLLERNDTLSPETLSQSSHDTADGGSGMQVYKSVPVDAVCLFVLNPRAQNKVHRLQS